MRSLPLPQAEFRHNRRSPRPSSHLTRRPGALFIPSLAVCAAAFLAASALGAAQTNQAQNNPAYSPSTPPVHKRVHPHKKIAVVVPAPLTTPPPAPVAPPPPDWPTNDPPA